MEIVDRWRKSTFSGNGGADCVEVATTADAVAVRDSKNPEGPRMAVPATGWREFVSRVQRDQ